MCEIKNTKKCIRCGEEKQLNMFSINKKSKDGLFSYCRLCRKEYRKDNIEKIKKYEQTYSKTDKFKESQKNYKNKNKEELNQYRKKYRKDVLLNDHLFILKSAIRDSIRHRLKFKGILKKDTTQNILGCTFEEFKKHIESLWEPWMNWDNYGNPKDGIFEPNKTWDLDHITPISTAKTEEEVYFLNKFTNFQPLCSYYNRFIKKHHIIF